MIKTNSICIIDNKVYNFKFYKNFINKNLKFYIDFITLYHSEKWIKLNNLIKKNKFSNLIVYRF